MIGVLTRVVLSLSAALLCGCSTQLAIQIAAPMADTEDVMSADPAVVSSVPDLEGDLSLDQALNLAFRMNPQLAAAIAEIRAAEARAWQANRYPNPELEAEVEEFGGTGEFKSFDVAEYSVVIGQEIPLGGKRSKRSHAAELERDLAGWDYKRARWDLIAEVRIAFIDVLAAQEDVALAAKLLAVAQELRETTDRRVAAGAASSVEQMKARIELSTIRIEHDRVGQTLETARESLAAMWGSPSARFARVSGDIERIAPPPRKQDLIAHLDSNPDLTRLPVELELRNAVLKLERAARVPDLEVAGGWIWFSEIEEHAFVASFGLPLPLFDRNQGGIRAAEFDLEKTRLEALAARVSSTTALAGVYRDLVASYREAMSLRRELVPTAEASFEATSKGFRDGRLAYIDVLDAQRTLFKARGQYRAALVSYHKAVAEVERLVGRSPGARSQKSD